MQNYTIQLSWGSINTFIITVKLEKLSLWPMPFLQHAFLLRNMSHMFTWGGARLDTSHT